MNLKIWMRSFILASIFGGLATSAWCLENPDVSVSSAAKPFPVFLKADRLTPPVESDPRDFELVSDPDTKVLAYLMQCQYADDPFLIEFLKVIRKNIRVWIMVRNQERANELWENLEKAGVKERRKRLRFGVNENQPLKKWARDPFIVLYNEKKDRFTFVPAYPSEDYGPNWIADRFAHYNINVATVVKNNFPRIDSWFVEGGVLTADDEFAYMGSDAVAMMRKFHKSSPPLSNEDVLRSVADIVSKKILLLPAADLHSDRYHLPVGKTRFGNRTSLVADPIQLLTIIASLSEEEKKVAREKIMQVREDFKDKRFLKTPEGKDEVKWLDTWLNPEGVDKFLSIKPERIENFKQSFYVKALDAIEDGLRQQGITVVRIPALSHSYDYYVAASSNPKDGMIKKEFFFPFGLYYLNAIQDSAKGERSIVIPRYGIKKLDQIVYEKYESLGAFKKIHQIKSVIEGTQGAGPRCRVQVIGIPQPPAPLVGEKKPKP